MSDAQSSGEKKSKGAGCLRWLGWLALGFVALLVVAGIVGAIYQGVASASDAGAYRPVDQMVDVNGLEMRLDCRGRGAPTVVLEAGAQSSSSVWVLIQDEVASFTRVCSYDRAGYGWSDPVPEAMLPQQVADRLHALLEKAGEEPPYLMVGHSFGGVYVRAFASEYPDEVAGIVLVDSSHENQSQQIPPALANSPEYTRLQEAGTASLQILQIIEPMGLVRALRLLDAAARIYPEEERPPALAEMYRTGYLGANARETEMMSTYAAQPQPLGDLPLVVLSQQVDAQEMYEQYQLLLQGTATMELGQQLADVYNEDQDDLAALSRRGQRIIVEDSGHFIQLEKPEVVIDAIREVFEQVAE